MPIAYTPWIGRTVVLRVRTEDLLVSLPGTVVSENETAVRLRVEQSWDVDIYKNMIIGVQQGCE
jgi:hypothetical protein